MARVAFWAAPMPLLETLEKGYYLGIKYLNSLATFTDISCFLIELSNKSNVAGKMKFTAKGWGRSIG